MEPRTFPRGKALGDTHRQFGAVPHAVFLWWLLHGSTMLVQDPQSICDGTTIP